MNICLVTNEYPPDTGWGGIATYTQALARELVRIGERVHIVALTVKDDYVMDDKGVTVHWIRWPGGIPYLLYKYVSFRLSLGRFHDVLLFSQRACEVVRRINEESPLDVIEAAECCSPGFFAFKDLDIPKKITRLHTPFFQVRRLNSMPENAVNSNRDYFEKHQTDMSTAVTSPTAALARIVEDKWGTKDINVIPNLFNLRNYTPDKEVYNGFLKGEDYLLYFGRLEQRKGVHLLAEALEKVFDKSPKIKAAFVGGDTLYTGSSMKELMLDILKEHTDRVVFLDNIPHASLYPIIERSRFVVLPSLWENFPYTCLEAMAFKKPVIATTGSGFSEIIQDNVSGFLVPPGDAASLERMILKCLDAEDLEEVGERAFERVKDFDTEKVARRMLEFYKQV